MEWLGSTSIYTAKNQPYKYPNWTKESNDAVKNVIGTVILLHHHSLLLQCEKKFKKIINDHVHTISLTEGGCC